MALAPTLLTFRNIAVGVGAVALAGLAVTSETGIRAPSTGPIAIGGQAPTITVQLGPAADPDVSYVEVVGQIPFLQRILVVAPGLPDTAPESNDLTPTLVWQDSPTPAAGLAIIQGLAPAVVGDTGQSIAITSGLVIINGLAPTLDLPAGQSGITEPSRIAFQIVGQEPSLALDLTIEIAPPELFAIVGFAPSLSLQVGWESVPTAQGPSWTDVPRV